MAGALNGSDLIGAFEAATRCLERQRDAINALNVFPVPDGDTGTNMLLTMRSVNQESLQATDSTAGAVSAAMAQGALLGARGNSGVILSQFFNGLAQGFRGKESLDALDLARAFDLASQAAYKSVNKPVDGTMLTVIRRLSLAASRQIEVQTDSQGPLDLWRVALSEAEDALARTPTQLQVLRDAGVVDAGGQGIVTILQGAGHYLAGGNVDELELTVCAPVLTGTPPADSLGEAATGESGTGGLTAEQISIGEEYLAATEDELYGYCTQFLVQGEGLDVDAVRERLSEMALSTVVVGHEKLVKVHVHVHDPGPVISYAISLGAIGQVSMDNMDGQHREFVSLHRGRTAEKDGSSDTTQAVGIAVVAVARGDGFVELFQGLGCGSVVPGGQTMNPSTQELLEAARETGARDVIVLPNNRNVIPGARQAATLASEDPLRFGGLRLHVVPSRTIPQGVAALLAFNPEGELDSNIDSMNSALAAIKTIEVTRAVRATTIGELEVTEGQHIGLLEGELLAAGDSAMSVLQQVMGNLEALDAGMLLTLYWGEDIQEAEAREMAGQLGEAFPGPEIELVHGGQPHYPYIVSVE